MEAAKNIRVMAPASAAGIAKELEKSLYGYRVPTAAVKKSGMRSLAEAEGSWLIVVCTPETPADPEILRETDALIEAGKRDRILTLLSEGTPDSSFPENLVFEKRADGTVVRREPLAANITAADGRPDLRRLRVERLRLIAPMLGLSFDDLMDRGRRRRERIIFAAGAALFTAAAVFLSFAVSRMSVMKQQNRELQAQYEGAELAAKEAEEQRDLARETLAETTALKAEELLAQKDTELALLLCLEYLPEMEHLPVLTDVFTRSLEILCADGFVPVTTENAYKRTRDLSALTPEPLTAIPGTYTSAPQGMPNYFQVPTDDLFPDGGYLNETCDMSVEVYSLEHDYVVYSGKLDWEGSRKTAYGFMMIVPISDPESPYLLGGPPVIVKEGISDVRALPDGTFIISSGRNIMRFDPALNAQIPVCEGGDDLTLELPFEVTKFTDHPGIPDRFFGLAEHGIAVFGEKTMDLIYVINDENTDYCITAPNGTTYWDGTILAALPDGGSRIVVGETWVYDGEDGRFLYMIEDYGQSGAVGILKVSAEGWLPFWLGERLCVVDLADGHIVDMISDTGGDNHSLYGAYDELTGQTSASRLLIYKYPDYSKAVPRMFWEYREEAAEVPEDMEGKIALAKELLGKRRLIPSERRAYFMDGE